MKINKSWFLLFGVFILMGASESSCDNSSDTKQRVMQEKLLQEGTAQTGMPAIKNFRERKILKEILATEQIITKKQAEKYLDEHICFLASNNGPFY